MKKIQKLDYEALKKRTIDQLRSGKALFGKDGAFALLLKEILEAAQEGNMKGHLNELWKSRLRRQQLHSKG